MGDTEFYGEMEICSREEREATLFSKLPSQLRHAQQYAPAYTELLREINPQEINNREALAALPITRKLSLLELQKANPPFGGGAVLGMGQLSRVFLSPGPIFEPQSRRDDFWRLARAMHDVCKLRCEVSLIAPGSLENESKVIDDRRSYE